MNQELEAVSTNYLDPQTFDRFLHWLVRLEPFINCDHRYPMDANHFAMMFRLMYGCGLRVSEALKLEKRDFDLDHKILKLRDAKTGKGKVQKTTILPYDIARLRGFLITKADDQRLFPTTRMTVWKYARNAGRLGGLSIFESQVGRDITNVWTHLFRKSCSKRMQNLGASRELRMKKLRHSFRDAHDAYDVVDLNTLLDWEAKHLAKPDLGTVTT